MDKNFILKIVVIGIALLFIFFILDRIFGFTKKWKEEKEAKQRNIDLLAAAGDEDAKLKKEGIPLSYPISKYKTLADGLYNAMKGGGTDTNRVFQIFSQLGNSRDFLELQKAFGVRGDENLNQWIAGDLSSKHIAELNAYLRKKGIKYNF